MFDNKQDLSQFQRQLNTFGCNWIPEKVINNSELRKTRKTGEGNTYSNEIFSASITKNH